MLDPSVTREMLEQRGKGGLGVLTEKYFFGYEPNSSPLPDFEEAGVELKTTPLKELQNGRQIPKERLVCDIINYCDVVNVPFEESAFYRKSILMLILFYFHVSGRPLCDLEFLYSVLWQIKDKDLTIIRQDYEFIVNKIRNGLAHELSEGDTMYLGACRKGQKGDPLRKQPFNDQGAPQRAFSLKQSYLRTILEFVKSSGKSIATNTDVEIEEKQLVSTAQLEKESFEDVLINRFKPFVGKDYKQIARHFKMKVSPKEKSKYARVAKRILLKGLNQFEDAEEIRKAGIIAKTIRINANGTIRESMSFENIDYNEIYSNDEWVESRWYEIVTSKFMFVVFREEPSPRWKKEKRYVFDRLIFWTMPNEDIEDAEKYWENLRKNVLADTLLDAQNDFWQQGQHRKFHVRPKARISAEKYLSPISGIEVPKKAYWFNSEYVTKILQTAYGKEWSNKFKSDKNA